jgi:hypothetical protein
MTGVYQDTYTDTYGGVMARRMFDAAWPPNAPPKVDIVNRYIGGGTPHVWTQAETDSQVAKSGARFVLPNFVRVPPTSHDPKDDAAWVVGWLRSNGVPKGVTHALDYETAIDATYLRAYDAVIVAAGYRTMVYGSRSRVLQNPKPSGGYWTAHWNNTPHICSDAGVVATQYGGDTTLGQPWDINLVADSVPLWNVTGQEADVASYEDWTAAGKAAFWQDANDKVAEVVIHFLDHGNTKDGSGDHHQAIRKDLASLRLLVQGENDATQTAVAGLQLAAVDPIALATALGPLLGADLADQVAAELATRLES